MSQENAERLAIELKLPCNWVEAVEKRFIKSKYRIKNKDFQVGIINWYWFVQVISLDSISSTDSISINNINKIYKKQVCICFVSPKCVSSSCFMLLAFVCLWHCECVIKCSYPAWMKYKFFRTHLKWFWNAFHKAEICWKALTKGETLNSCELTFQAYCYNDLF